MLKLIKDEDLRKRLVKNATAYIEKNSWDVHKKKYLDLALIQRQRSFRVVLFGGSFRV
jgi:glycosyltransferase involved in cell wall biosynthesis